MGVKQRSKSLKRRQSDLSDSFVQLEVLNGKGMPDVKVPSFHEKLKLSHPEGIKPLTVEVLQINIGKLCNQSCAHCHVDAGPDRKVENMDKETLYKCLEIVKKHNISTIDITGGAPEMNPHFRWMVKECRKLGINVVNRCNLTIIEAHSKYSDLPQFFAENNVHLISSLPYFSKSRTDSQRGDGVFEDSITALQKLNAVGYGKEGSGLILDLVYNPSGSFLPGDQHSLENEFKRQLNRKYGISFNHLFAITNLPISRFLDYLLESGNYESYMGELISTFNPATIDGLMCRNTLSVSWEGYIYDCDFNQMLDLKSDVTRRHINNLDMDEFKSRSIVTNQHCFGCTAGSGSSCGGEIV